MKENKSENILTIVAVSEDILLKNKIKNKIETKYKKIKIKQNLKTRTPHSYIIFFQDEKVEYVFILYTFFLILKLCVNVMSTHVSNVEGRKSRNFGEFS